MAQANIVVQVDGKRVDLSSSTFPDELALEILRKVTGIVLGDPSISEPDTPTSGGD